MLKLINRLQPVAPTLEPQETKGKQGYEPLHQLFASASFPSSSRPLSSSLFGRISRRSLLVRGLPLYDLLKVLLRLLRRQGCGPLRLVILILIILNLDSSSSGSRLGFGCHTR
jgi:hypothetical protein